MCAPPTFRRWYFGVKQSEILELGVGWQTFRAAVEEPFCSFRFQIFSPFTKILRSHKNVLHGVQSEELFALWLIAAVDDLECSSGTHGERILKLGCDIRGRHSRAFGALVDDTHAQSLFGIELDRYTVSGFQRIRWYFAHMSFRGLVIQFGRYGRGRMSAFPDEFATLICVEKEEEEATFVCSSEVAIGVWGRRSGAWVSQVTTNWSPSKLLDISSSDFNLSLRRIFGEFWWCSSVVTFRDATDCFLSNLFSSSL